MEKRAVEEGTGRVRGANDNNSTESHIDTGHIKTVMTDEEWTDVIIGKGNIDRTPTRETIRATQPVHTESPPATPRRLCL